MSQENALAALIILQIAGVVIAYNEWENIKAVPVRFFMIILPALTILSILVNPLEG